MTVLMISAITRHREASVNPLNSLTRPSQAPTTTTSTTIIITTIPATKITTAALVCEDGVGDDDDYDEVDRDDFLSFQTPVYDCHGLHPMDTAKAYATHEPPMCTRAVAAGGIYRSNVIRHWDERCCRDISVERNPVLERKLSPLRRMLSFARLWGWYSRLPHTSPLATRTPVYRHSDNVVFLHVSS